MADARVIPISAHRSPEERARCAGLTVDGNACRNRAGESGYCAKHKPPVVRHSTGSLQEGLASGLEFLRRRMTGEYPVDVFGFDRDLTEHVLIPLMRVLYKHWWRIAQVGVDNLPSGGPALFVSNHSGTLPFDALMLKAGVFESAGRHVRLLAADLALALPLVGEMARKSGNTLACDDDATRLLESGECVGVFPEGYKGIGKPFRERYRLQRFGRGGFVEVALRTGAPIIPVAIVGAEEIYPMIANLGPLARLLGFPYFPITPTFPLLGPLGAIPLPSRWIIEYGEPIETVSFGPESAADPMFVFNLTDRIREVIQQTLFKNLAQRHGIFF